LRIYTKTGDKGETGLIGGSRVSKSDPVIEAVGGLDELNSALGLARLYSAETEFDALLERAQRVVFEVGSEVACPPDGRFDVRAALGGVVEALEQSIDDQDARLPKLTQFILPGGGALAVHLHAARSTCRSAERRLVALGHERPIRGELIVFVNRLSDWLFTAARTANLNEGRAETVWYK
jgi:cob(I)alamin adenosyltransferase